MLGVNNMNILTKNTMKVIPMMTVLAFSFVIEAKPSDKEDKKVDVKCFVELVGGSETITFWNIPSKTLPHLSSKIEGQKIMGTSSKEKVKIYKSHECVLLKDDFSSTKAKTVDKKTAR